MSLASPFPSNSIPKEEMHFQPLEDIAENLEESGGRHPNLALFNRLLNVAPSPTGLVGGALRRTSAQLQSLRRSPGVDPPTSDDDDEGGKLGTGGSLPSGLGQDTQSTLCSFRGEVSARTPLLEIQFGAGHERRKDRYGEEEEKSSTEDEKREDGWKAERKGGERPVSLLPPPLQPSRGTSKRPASVIASTCLNPSALLLRPAARSTRELSSSQPVIDPNRAVPTLPKPPDSGAKMAFLTVPSCNGPQRLRSVSMGSEFTSS